MISVVVPTYNYAHFLTATIKSIQLQTYGNWECIIIDDGSTDNTKQLIERLSAADNRIKYFYQKNAGPAVARNLGIRKSTGEFIQFLDGDDLIENKKFEIQRHTLEQHAEYDIVYGGVKYFTSVNPEKLFLNINLNDQGAWMSNVSGKGDEVILNLIEGNIMVISSPLIRKSVFNKFGGFDEQLYYNEDWELWLRLAINNVYFKFKAHEQTNALIRVHSSYSKDNLKMFIYGLKVCLKISRLLTKYKYNKILIPKINYHKKIIDEKLIELLSVDPQGTIETIQYIYKETGLRKYKNYSVWFRKFNKIQLIYITKIISYYNKFSSILIYGA